MPRSIEQILQQADELADRFEAYEPPPDDEIGIATYELRQATLGRARSEQRLADAVVDGRRAGLSWKQIGTELGISAQAAQQRYRSIVERA